MRSLSCVGKLTAIAGLLTLAGCLVSDYPLLDASNGNATPIDPGAYAMCRLGDEDNGADCQQISINHDENGLYRFDNEDEEPVEMRFRRIGRKAFVVQSLEVNDDTYLYYYGAGNSRRFRLTMMLCADLPVEKRAQWMEDGDLESDDDEFSICAVNTLNGLTAAAKAYDRGETQNAAGIVLELTPAPTEVE